MMTVFYGPPIAVYPCFLRLDPYLGPPSPYHKVLGKVIKMNQKVEVLEYWPDNLSLIPSSHKD